MSRNRDAPGPDVRGTVQALLKQSSLPGVRATQEEIVRALTEAAAAVADAHAERDHWRASFAKVQMEMVAAMTMVILEFGRNLELSISGLKFKAVADHYELHTFQEGGVMRFKLVKTRPKNANKVVLNG